MAAPNLGQGIDRGNYRRRNGITPPAVQGKAAGAVAQTVFFGTATGPVTHATTGALTGQGSAVVGSAARVGGAVTHSTTGALTGPGSTATGSAARTRQFATSGTLTGPGSALAGSARHNIPHPATGTLTGPGSSLAGSAARTRAFATSGALAGQGAALAGVAARTRAHPTTGVLSGSEAALSGAAARGIPAVSHATTGGLVGAAAVLEGAAAREAPQPVLPAGGGGSGPWSKKALRERDRKLEDERQERQSLRELVARAIEPVKAAEPATVQVVTTAKGGVSLLPSTGPVVALPEVPQFDAAAVAREVQRALQEAGIAVQRVRQAQARQAAAEALEAMRRENERRLRKRRRDEEILLLM